MSRAVLEEPGVVSLDAHRLRSAVPWYRVAAVAAVLVGVAGVGVYGNRGAPVAIPVGPRVDSPRVLHSAQSTQATPGAIGSRVDTPTAGVGVTPRASRPTTAGTTDALGAMGGVASGATDDELEALIGGLESLSGIPETEAAEAEETVRMGGEP